MGGYSDVEYKFKKIGKNVVIGKNVYFRYPEATEIGDNVIIDEFCYFTTTTILGSYIHIGPHCSVVGGIQSRFVMENFSGMSAGCRIACASDDYVDGGATNPTIPKALRAHVNVGSVILRKFSTLGTNVVVHPDVEIGVGSVVGSMSLVTKPLDSWGVYVGVPAKYVKPRPSEFILLHKKKFNKLVGIV